MYVHANFQNAINYKKKVAMEEVERFDQPSYVRLFQTTYSSYRKGGDCDATLTTFILTLY